MDLFKLVINLGGMASVTDRYSSIEGKRESKRVTESQRERERERERRPVRQEEIILV